MIPTRFLHPLHLMILEVQQHLLILVHQPFSHFVKLLKLGNPHQIFALLTLHLSLFNPPLSGGGMKGPDSSFLIPDYHNPTYNEDFPPLAKNFDFEEGDLQEDNPLTPSYGSDPESYSKNINRSGFTAKKLSSRAQALDRVA
ncbi:hypothetical protein FRX31_020677 [Thalictrum thalictroides]|uniref:Uncharacterized protein n=1 Tax=Thalictrum thalictroides TaxID=46969 RepID=A0A7J6VX78_THATH|nr:hypothetical protein FRX31_020677 [Thalictrum thalictroides]